MEKGVFCEKLSQKADKFNVKLSKKQLDQFYEYMNLLIEWNQKMNLTTITEPNEVIEKHFIDSLSIAKYLESAKSILDIGTGAGFPGIPLKIVEHEKEFTLLDALNKRINFLQEVITGLKLERVEAIHGRAEEIIKQKNKREIYDIVTSRAVAKLNVLLEYMLPFTKVGGKCICMKAMDIDEELNEAQKAIQVLGGKLETVDMITLPDSNIERKIVVIKKVRSTPIKFPRKAGMPTKEPIN